MSARTQIKTEAAMGTQTPSGWRQAGFWVCIVIAVAVVVRRVLALANAAPGAAPQLAALNAFFASHAGLTLAHILPALAFVGLAPWVVYHRSAATGLPLRLMFPLGAVVGITAYAMAVDAFGGWVERSAVLVFNTLFLYSLSRAYWYMRHGEAPSQRRWMLRAIGVLLGIATTRPVMGIFFATSRLTHLEPRQFFGWAFWIGFSVNTLMVERWLRSTESPARMAASTPEPRT
jgi:cytochrome b561